MEKIKWYIKQLLPLQYISQYSVIHKDATPEKKLSIWRMWFGRCFWHREYTLK